MDGIELGGQTTDEHPTPVTQTNKNVRNVVFEKDSKGRWDQVTTISVPQAGGAHRFSFAQCSAQRWKLTIVDNWGAFDYVHLSSIRFHGAQASGAGRRSLATDAAARPAETKISNSSNAGGQQQSGGDENGAGRRQMQRTGDNSHTWQQAQAPTHGQVERMDIIILSRADLARAAATTFGSSGSEVDSAIEALTTAETTGRRLQRSGDDTQAQDMNIVTRIFTNAQQPHVVYPLTIEATATGGGGDGKGRRLQRSGGGDLQVQIVTHAPTEAEAQAAVDAVAAQTGGTEQGVPQRGRRRAQATDPSCHRAFATDTELATALVVDTNSMEAQAAAIYYTNRAGYASLAAPPTIDEMLVGGSTAAGILASIFTNEQEPHSVEVASVSLQPPDGLDPHGGGGHRRTQRTGDTVYVQIVTHAPTPAEAERAVAAAADRFGGTVQG